MKRGTILTIHLVASGFLAICLYIPFHSALLMDLGKYLFFPILALTGAFLWKGQKLINYLRSANSAS